MLMYQALVDFSDRRASQIKTFQIVVSKTFFNLYLGERGCCTPAAPHPLGAPLALARERNATWFTCKDCRADSKTVMGLTLRTHAWTHLEGDTRHKDSDTGSVGSLYKYQYFTSTERVQLHCDGEDGGRIFLRNMRTYHFARDTQILINSGTSNLRQEAALRQTNPSCYIH
jgi:hypothetical protein